MIELPPLPYGASPAYGYTEAEMRAYGEACARAAIEAAAADVNGGLGEWFERLYRAEFTFDSSEDMLKAAYRAGRASAATAPSSPSSSQTRS
jgi:hypothetical protein